MIFIENMPLQVNITSRYRRLIWSSIHFFGSICNSTCLSKRDSFLLTLCLAKLLIPLLLLEKNIFMSLGRRSYSIVSFSWRDRISIVLSLLQLLATIHSSSIRGLKEKQRPSFGQLNNEPNYSTRSTDIVCQFADLWVRFIVLSLIVAPILFRLLLFKFEQDSVGGTTCCRIILQDLNFTMRNYATQWFCQLSRYAADSYSASSIRCIRLAARGSWRLLFVYWASTWRP